MDSTRVTMLGIIGGLGAVLGMMEFVLPLPMGLMLIYIFQEYRKEVTFSVLTAKSILLLEAVMCLNLFYVIIFFVTCTDEIAGVIVFSRATCIDNKTLITTGAVSAVLQNTFTAVCAYLMIGTTFTGNFSDTIVDVQWFTSGVLIPYIIIASVLYGLSFISVFRAVQGSLNDIRAVIMPYTGKIQELNNMTNYIQQEVELIGKKE